MDTYANPLTLYRHTKRDDWGLAILAWEGRKRRRYQFEDGKLRTFAQGFYQLLEEVEAPPERAAALRKRLVRDLDIARARREVVQDAQAKGKSLTTMDDQATAFRLQYPEGFQGAAWKAEVRGVDAPRRLKSHRDAAVAEARELLDKARLEGLLAEGRHAAILEDVATVLAGTDLASPSQDVRPLRELPEDEHAAAAKALYALLWGEGDLAARFDAWVEAIMPADGDGPRWQAATAPLALVHPTDEVCVRPSSFRTQARWLRPTVKHQARPSGGLYLAYRQMARDLCRHLMRHDLHPTDLLDAHDFMRLTLGPKAKRLLEAHRSGGSKG